MTDNFQTCVHYKAAPNNFNTYAYDKQKSVFIRQSQTPHQKVKVHETSL